MSSVPKALPYVARPARVFIRVVLPAPDGPMMAVTRPGRHWPVTPRSTSKPLLRRTRPSRTKRKSSAVSVLSLSDGSSSTTPSPAAVDGDGRALSDGEEEAGGRAKKGDDEEEELGEDDNDDDDEEDGDTPPSRQSSFD